MLGPLEYNRAPETAAAHVALKMCLLATNSAVTPHSDANKKSSNKDSLKGKGDALNPN